MKIIKSDKVDIRNVEDVDTREFFTWNIGTYIVSKVNYDERKVKAFNLDVCVMTEFDFKTQVIYKPHAYVVLDK